MAVNEIALWNTTHVFALWLWLTVVGFLLTRGGSETPWRTGIGMAALIVVLFAYEVYLVVFAVCALLEGCVALHERSAETRKVVGRRIAVFLSLVGVYALGVMSMRSLGVSGGRSFAKPASIQGFLDVKVHATIDLAVNIWMPCYAPGPLDTGLCHAASR